MLLCILYPYRWYHFIYNGPAIFQSFFKKPEKSGLSFFTNKLLQKRFIMCICLTQWYKYTQELFFYDINFLLCTSVWIVRDLSLSQVCTTTGHENANCCFSRKKQTLNLLWVFRFNLTWHSRDSFREVCVLNITSLYILGLSTFI